MQATAIAAHISALDDADRYAAACRGSANPVALAWLAESLVLGQASAVLDLGAGLGGPAAWLQARYGCRVVALEPAPCAAVAAKALFGLAVVRAHAGAVPLRSGAFDSALLLGVLSVVRDGPGVLDEAARLASTLGILDYCATGPCTVEAGGSHFLPAAALLATLTDAGWSVDQTSTVPVDPPQRWSDARNWEDLAEHDDERAVAFAIRDGSIAAFMAVAHR